MELKKHSNKAFTLFELVVVILLISFFFSI
ncbi:MAG: type II secretion system protein [Candidatus Ratteibacteria bacterium]